MHSANEWLVPLTINNARLLCELQTIIIIIARLYEQNRAIENNNHYSRISNVIEKMRCFQSDWDGEKKDRSIEIDVSELKNHKKQTIKRKLAYLDLFFIIISKSSSQEINPVIKSFFNFFIHSMPNFVQSVNGKCEANKDNGICHVIEIKTAINHINTLFLCRWILNTYYSGLNTIYGIYDKMLYAKCDWYPWSMVGA